MMHYQFHPLGMSIVVKRLDIKVRIWGHKVEDILLHVAEPVFPADVPSLNKHCIETVLCRKINMLPYIFIVGCVRPVRFYKAKIVCVKVNASESVRVRP